MRRCRQNRVSGGLSALAGPECLRAYILSRCRRPRKTLSGPAWRGRRGVARIESDTQMSTWVTIDGAEGEGGGQLLRTALSLSLVTRTPFRIERIRAGRKKPGLLRQHLNGVEPAVQVGGARVAGGAGGQESLVNKRM